MTDRPSLEELIDAVRQHIETALLPLVRGEPKLYFQTLVALNLLRIATREIAAGPDLEVLEQDMLRSLTGNRSGNIGSVRAALCRSIRAGDLDSPEVFGAALDGLSGWVQAQLSVNNPVLAQRMQSERDSGAFAL